MCWDANNLYGWAMSEYLPYKGLKFNAHDKILETALTTANDSTVGYAIECCLICPIDIHNKRKEYPPAPENIKPDAKWFSGFQKALGIDNGSVAYSEEEDAYKK